MEDINKISHLLQRFEEESLTELTEKLTEILTDQELVKGGNLRSPQDLRNDNYRKVKAELHAVCEKIRSDVAEATQVIMDEVSHFLTEKELQDFIEDIRRIADKLEECEKNEITSQIESIGSPAEFFGLAEETMRSIYNAGYRRYEMKDFENAAKIFFILTTLSPFVSDYWLAYGLTNHQLKLYEMALICFEHAIFLKPVKPLARWYAVEAHLALEQWDKAFSQWEALDKLIQEQGLDENWQTIASYLKAKIDHGNKYEEEDS